MFIIRLILAAIFITASIIAIGLWNHNNKKK